MSEKPRGRLWRSPTNRRATSFRPISPSSYQPNPRSQRYSCPFRRSNPLGAASARFPSPLRRPPRSPREMPDPALSQLAWAHAHETLLWASKGGGSRHTFNYDLINSRDPTSQLSSVWHIPSVPNREKLHGYHPTQKPLRLLRRAILASSKEGDLVFDPFCGSGTSGVASKELNRFFVGAEKEGEYAELAGRRIGAADRGVVLREIPDLGQRERF
jgi:hypothetical protein